MVGRTPGKVGSRTGVGKKERYVRGERCVQYGEVPKVSGSFAAFRMTAKADKGTSKNRQRKEEQKQIPFGDDKQISNRKSEIQRHLHCAADDEVVRRFGRDDVLLAGGESVVIGWDCGLRGCGIGR